MPFDQYLTSQLPLPEAWAVRKSEWARVMLKAWDWEKLWAWEREWELAWDLPLCRSQRKIQIAASWLRSNPRL